MNVARISHTATLLSNGVVLVAGGDSSSLGDVYLSSAELYNPSTGSWTLTGSMTTRRQGHQAVLFQYGQVLVAGGGNASGTLASAELYDPSTEVWTATGSMNTARSNFGLTLLNNGEVLTVPGTSAELYNPAKPARTRLTTSSSCQACTSKLIVEFAAFITVRLIECFGSGLVTGNPPVFHAQTFGRPCNLCQVFPLSLGGG